MTLSATPDPVDPLQISFHAGAVTGTPTGFNWSFGDGHYLNGTTGAYSSPVHRYAAPGNYTAAVVVLEGTSSSSQSMVVDVRPAPLVASIQVANDAGGPPRTVTFTAVLSGGTGTFRSVNWTFGDGGSGVGTTIQYSYVRSGNFQVVLQVVDSSGASASSSTWVNVSAPSGPSVALTSSVVVLVALGGAAAAAGIALGVYLGRWGWDRATRLPGDLPPGATGEWAPPGALERAATPGRPNGAPSPAPPGRPRPETPPGPDRSEATGLAADPARRPIPVATVPPPEGPRPVVINRTALYLSQRIVLHLAQLGSLGPDEVAPVGFTQLGISQALQVRQNALTNVLRRLVAAGAITEDVRHVRGQARRLKVYRLSSRGEALAHDLRAQGLSLSPETAARTVTDSGSTR